MALRVHSDSDAYRLRWWITLAVMLVTILEVLDMTIVTVALPDMMGSLEANTDQISWVLTSYAVSTAIMMPLTGFLVARIGCRRLMLINIIGFMLASMLCGFAPNLSSMVVFRVLQGLFGAGMMPLSQFVIRAIFPHKEQGLGLAVWSIGMLCAPIFGPVLGGYITGQMTWRWIFYLNMPVCLLALALILMLIRETVIERKPIDWLGLSLLVIGIAALQIFLDRGNSVNWYESTAMSVLTMIFSVSLLAFVWRSWFVRHPVIQVRLFKNRTFSVYLLMMFFFSLFTLGQIVQAPLMMQTLYHYPVVTAGLLMAPRGLGCIVAMLMVGPFVHRIPTRALLIVGLAISVTSVFLLGELSTQLNVQEYGWISAAQGVGMGFFLLPIVTFSVQALKSEDMAEGSGLLSFCRSIGMSIGVSLLTTVLMRSQCLYWQHLSANATWFNPFVQMQLQAKDVKTGLVAIVQQMYFQSNLLAFNHVALFTSAALVFILPLIFWLKPKAIEHLG